MMRTKTRGIGVAAAMWVAAAAAGDAPLRVAATTPLLADVVAAVGGDRVRVESLLPRAVDPHAFQPRPADVRRLSAAQAIYLNGLGLETPWERLLTAAGREKWVDLSEGMTVRHLAEPCTACDDHAHHAHGDPVPDPHVWLDPTKVAHWADRIAADLARRDPEHADAYRARADAYRAKLDELDRWIRTEVETVPEDRRRMVTDHASFGYFCDRYGFRQEATLMPGFSTLAQPSARDLAQLEEQVRAENIRALFVGETGHTALARRVARDTGAKVIPLYTCTLGAPDGPAGDYLSMMRHTVRAIVDGLK
jgi:ABC-type Zn uptake system ZnuABC Zn-binding protein ZnuA